MMDEPSMDMPTQLEVGRFILGALEERGLEGILVGTNAAVARGVMTTLSKDSDIVVVGYRSAKQVRAVVRRIATDNGLEHEEQGWGVLTVRKKTKGEAPRVLWAADVILPASGMIPTAAAKLIARHATETKWGKAAVEEHIIATKAVASVDRAKEGQTDLSLKYQTHLELMAGAIRRPLDWDLASALLACYVEARRQPAVGLINEFFGAGLT